MAQAPKERKAAERERMRALGLKRLEVYAHPDDWPQIRKYVARLNKRSEQNPDQIDGGRT